MISDLKRRARARRRVHADLAGDPSARFAYELATKPPTKDVASLKAASEVYEANGGMADSDEHELLCGRMRGSSESPDES